MITVKVEIRGQICYFKAEHRADAMFLIDTFEFAYGKENVKAEIL